ncbi:MAG: hypothetical protein GC149_16685 [Gammaproteobacteria bacterium]|nr:hypothetical protein [Gammaproteobacteria bacterium]
MIFLFTDFGWNGPYIGEMKAVLSCDLTDTVIDLMHDAPVFNPMASAYLLAALSKRFVAGDFCLGVVDPGVGDDNRRVLYVDADDVHYIGPDNGLFAVLAARAKRVRCQEIRWRPQIQSASFHGRDVFAPIVARLLHGKPLDSQEVPLASLVGADYPGQLKEVIYIDHYGNVITGLNAGICSDATIFSVEDKRAAHAHTFSSVAPGQLFWYENSMGLIEIAANQANACQLLGCEIGTPVDLIIP